MGYMSLDEFVEAGYLQEVNRSFFHPLGLALEVVADNGAVVRLNGIKDYREDAEGVIFADLTTKDHLNKAHFVDEERKKRTKVRRSLFGVKSNVQPLGTRLETRRGKDVVVSPKFIGDVKDQTS